MKDEEGSGGASPSEANRMKRSQIKLKLLLFDQSDFFFSLGQFIFYFFFNRAMLHILSQIKKHVFFNTNPDYQMVRPKTKV